MAKHVEKLKNILGKGKVYDDEYIRALYAREASGLEAPDNVIAVVFAESPSDVSKLLSYAYRSDVKVYPQGSATSLSGLTTPIEPGIILSLERMRSIREISVVDSYAEVEPGLRIDELNAVLAGYGYMFPVDPASARVATVGGAINSGAGGMKGARYGTMRDWVLGLEIVVPDENGTVMEIGCKTVKCRQGYDLVRLIVGSEGTLAVVTKAVLRITPEPESVAVALAFFKNLEELANAVIDIKKKKWQIMIMEFMDSRTVSAAKQYSGLAIDAHGEMLLVGIETCREGVKRVAQELEHVLRSAGASRVYTAYSLKEAEEKGFFTLRRSLFPAQVELSRKRAKNGRVHVLIEDIAVPPSKLIEAVEELKKLEEEYGIYMLLGGHVGDGNLHPAVGFNVDDENERKRVLEWFREVMRLAIRLGGTVSAEHGIGILKKEGLRMELEAKGSLKALELMKGIKKLFDPKNVLNPGKVV